MLYGEGLRGLGSLVYIMCNVSFVLYLNFQKEETKQGEGVMASDASHALEAALEQMDGIIAGTGVES